MDKKKKICDGCGQEIRLKHLAHIRGKYYCKQGLNCARIIRKNHRLQTIHDANLEEDLAKLDKKIKEESVKRVRAKNPKKEKPIILEKDNKKKGNKTPVKYNSLVLSMNLTDKQFLFKQKIAEGMSYAEADTHVRQVQDYLIDLGKTLRANKKLNDQDKNKIFQEEFEKLRYS